MRSFAQVKVADNKFLLYEYSDKNIATHHQMIYTTDQIQENKDFVLFSFQVW